VPARLAPSEAAWPHALSPGPQALPEGCVVLSGRASEVRGGGLNLLIMRGMMSRLGPDFARGISAWDRHLEG
jgi:hypothetical protein